MYNGALGYLGRLLKLDVYFTGSVLFTLWLEYMGMGFRICGYMDVELVCVFTNSNVRLAKDLLRRVDIWDTRYAGIEISMYSMFEGKCLLR